MTAQPEAQAMVSRETPMTQRITEKAVARIDLVRIMCHVSADGCKCADKSTTHDYSACRIVARHANAILAALPHLQCGDTAALSLCDHPDCQTWRSKPCGEGCYWKPGVSSPASAQGVEREGWKLVPLRADEKMIAAGVVAQMEARGLGDVLARAVYDAMLAASSPPT